MTESNAIPGGAFLLEEADPKAIFIPEAFGAEARLMAQTADDFLRREALPQTERIEAHDTELMAGLMRRAGELGLLGAEVPEVYGGLGLDNRTGALLAEKLNWQQSFALTHEAHTVLATFPLLFFGSPALKAKYLPLLASGEWIGAFCLSEPGSGSDALGAQTRAILDADGRRYRLNGTKMWITNTAFAQLFTVFAKVDGKKFTAFLVERDTPGVSFGREEVKLGMRGTSTRRVVLEDAPVPVENVIGEVGKGHYAAFCTLNMGRFKLEAGAVGGLKETLATCAAYAQQRRQFGQPLARFGLIQAKLGEMAARLFALESAVYRLAGLLDGVFAGIRADAEEASTHYLRAASEYAIECAVVKVVGSELYSWATDEAIQIHGGNGYTEEYPAARAWRDQRLLRIGEGANEVVRLMIVRELLRREEQGRLKPGSATALMAGGRAGDVDAEETDAALPRRLKAGALILLGMAREAFGESLTEEQETLAVIADLVSAAYVAESAWLRAARLPEPACRPAQDAARLYAETALLDAWRGAQAVLAHLPLDRSLRRLGEVNLQAQLTRAALHDPIELRRRLATAALEQGGFPWPSGG